ncbi:MAG: TolB family protein [Vicingaceae bacterium]
MKNTCLIFLLSLSLTRVYGQVETFKQDFKEANTLIEENQFKVALPIWLKLLKQQPTNANINYKIGLCYISTANDKLKSLDYFKKATVNTTKKYDPFSHLEKKAPLNSFLYLAIIQHINYDLDDATTSYNTFKKLATPKHFLYKKADLGLKQCENAKKAVATPVKTIVTNLGTNINSTYGDYSPVISVDESTIYFTSRRVRKDSSNIYYYDFIDGKHFEDIYVSNKYDSTWSEPELLNINTDGHEAIVNISADGQTLFIFKDDSGDGNIYTSTKSGDSWSEPIKIGSDVNLESRETHAHISPNDNYLYFVSDRDGGKGGKDIYVCKRLPNGEWAKAQNLGNTINSPYDEDGVFIHPDGKTMYFSSNGENSIGDYDIFYSTKDTDGNWTDPVNMGYPVNSTDDDIFFVTSADGKRGYFSSFKDEGYGEKDIYAIELEEAEEKSLTLLKGYMAVIGMKELPDDAEVVVTKIGADEKPKIYRPRKRDGKFYAILEPGNNYNIVYSTLKYSKTEDIYVAPSSGYQEINRAINLDDVIFGDSTKVSPVIITPETPKEIIDTTPIIEEPKEEDFVLEEYSFTQHFGYNKNKIDRRNPKYIKMIEGALKNVKKSRRVVISVKSSASKVPSRSFRTNDALAYKRAIDAQRHIKSELMSKGVSSKYIIFKEVNSSVNGPEYIQGKPEPREVYEKYQYVTITLK